MADGFDALRDSISNFISSSFLSGEPVAHDEDLLLTGKLDSLSVITLVAEVERQAGISIAPEQVTLENFVTVDAIATFAAGQQA